MNTKTKTIQFDGAPFVISDGNMPQWKYFDGNRTFGHEWEQAAIRLICNFIKPNMHFVDIGANFGAYSFLAARRGAIAHAFEPEEYNFRILKENMASYKSHLHQIALGATAGWRFLHLSSDQHGGHRITNQTKMGDIPVEMQRLDDFNIIADIIKVDVEGHGLQVLFGGRDTISRCAMLIVEIHNDEERATCQLMIDMGFDVLACEKGFIARNSKLEFSLYNEYG